MIKRAAAVVMCILYRKGKLQNVPIMGDSLINAFYICPQCDPHLPVYSLVQPLLPAGLDELVYIAGFTLASYLILLAAMGIKRLATKKSAAAVG